MIRYDDETRCDDRPFWAVGGAKSGLTPQPGDPTSQVAAPARAVELDAAAGAAPSASFRPLPALPLPWTVPPSGQGFSDCAWCGRVAYRPAVPCSEAVIRGIAEIEGTSLGLGDRCRWEIRTRGVGATAEPATPLPPGLRDVLRAASTSAR